MSGPGGPGPLLDGLLARPGSAAGDRLLRVGGHRLALTSATGEAAAWAERYMDGFWPVERAGDPAAAWRVVAVLDPEARRALAAAATAGRPAVASMGAPARLVDGAGGRLVAAVSRPVAWFRPGPGGGHGATVLVVADDAETLGLEVVRTLRTMAGAALEAGGWAHVHAAGSAGPGGALLAFGAKGAGKSAVALSLAARCGWSLLANDRAWVGPAGTGTGDGAGALPWPSSLNIGLGMLAALGWFEAVAARYQAGTPAPYHQHPAVTAALVAGDPAPVRDRDGRERKAQLLPADLVELTGVGLAQGGRLAAVVLPSVDLGRPLPAVAPAGPGQLGDADLIPVPGVPDSFPDVLGLHPGPAPARRRAARSVLAGVAGLVPAVRVRLSADLGANAAALATLAADPRS